MAEWESLGQVWFYSEIAKNGGYIELFYKEVAGKPFFAVGDKKFAIRYFYKGKDSNNFNARTSEMDLIIPTYIIKTFNLLG
jgi:hypothetical protein